MDKITHDTSNHTVRIDGADYSEAYVEAMTKPKVGSLVQVFDVPHPTETGKVVRHVRQVTVTQMIIEAARAMINGDIESGLQRPATKKGALWIPSHGDPNLS